jgi:phospholipase C
LSRSAGVDHTSVLKLLEEKWNLPALTAWDAAAAPLGALDLTWPRGFFGSSSLPEPGLRWGFW